DIDQEDAHPVPGAKEVYEVFWSPDNRWLGYSTGTHCGIRGGCDLVKIPVEGGSTTVITRLSGPFRRAYWSSDGETILYCDTAGMYTVPAKGGMPTRVLEHPHIEHPSIVDLPDGRQAYLYQTGQRDRRTHAIYIQLAGEKRTHFIGESSSVNPYPA